MKDHINDLPQNESIGNPGVLDVPQLYWTDTQSSKLWIFLSEKSSVTKDIQGMARKPFDHVQ